jgi:hypothetical protein
MGLFPPAPGRVGLYGPSGSVARAVWLPHQRNSETNIKDFFFEQKQTSKILVNGIHFQVSLKKNTFPGSKKNIN